MPVVYITGTKQGVGKTALATALFQNLIRPNGIAHLVKPVLSIEDHQPDTADPDSEYYNKINPGNLTPKGFPLYLTSDQLVEDATIPKKISDGIRECYSSEDLVIVEGPDGLYDESPSTLVSAQIAASLEAHVIGIVGFESSCNPESFLRAGEAFGPMLDGFILNNVPLHKTHQATSQIAPEFIAKGIPILGILPEDRSMLAPTVGDLAKHLSAEYLSSPEKSDELVEHIMTGGWFLDHGSYVFSRRDRKAVVTKGDRPDIQMAALKTSTVCLVLTAGQFPIQYVTTQAEHEGIPILLVETSTIETLEKLNSLADTTSVYTPQKTQRFAQLLLEFCTQEFLRNFSQPPVE